jgi:hypothetical protein
LRCQRARVLRTRDSLIPDGSWSLTCQRSTPVAKPTTCPPRLTAVPADREITNRDSEMHKTLALGISDIPISNETLPWSFLHFSRP